MGVVLATLCKDEEIERCCVGAGEVDMVTWSHGHMLHLHQ